jgi:hypothetical protein
MVVIVKTGTDSTGKLPHDWAIGRGFDEIAQLLQ